VSFPIQITPAGESADCRCTACEFAEETSGHAGVLQGLAHAAEHSLSTGHRATEHVVRDSVVSAPKW
jgi:hypothetical protein